MLAALSLSAVIIVADAVALPFSPSQSARLPVDAKWSVVVGDTTYYSPPAALLDLSQDISNYYSAYGSQGALTDEMKKHRVGGDGRWHIFHLPKGPSMMQIPKNGDRRQAVSGLLQLQHGAVLSNDFAQYVRSENYSSDPATEELASTAAQGITAAVFQDFLERLIPDSSSSRSYTNADGSKVAQTFIQTEFTNMGITRNCLHTFSSGGTSLANVVGFIPGSDPNAGTLTVGAHLDARNADLGGPGPAPGANDNGSGVAALLSVAKAFMHANKTPKKNVYFVAFAAEEPGLIGSRAFVEALLAGQPGLSCGTPPQGASYLRTSRKTASNHAAIIMDEVGWATTKYTKHTANLESYDWTTSMMDHLHRSSELANGETLDIVHNAHPFGSDHMSWLDKKMPAVLVINGDDEEYPHYHSVEDTIKDASGSYNVNFEYGAKMAKLVLGGVAKMAEL